MSRPGQQGPILVLNAGSSSIKFALFDTMLSPILSGMADGIGGASQLRIADTDFPQNLPTHEAALSAILTGLGQLGFQASTLRAAAHRVVHGGKNLTQPSQITPTIRQRIQANIPLAPLHNPHNLAAIDTLAKLAPDLPQFASFDTAFHATNPDVATHYAVPQQITDRGIRRYGFHGLSYASLVDLFPDLTSTPLPARVLALHLGNGASLCAIKDGRSVATTMGYSPLEGLTMGTRAGSLDANAVLRLVEEDGLDVTRDLLNSKSGLLGLSNGTSDMRALLAQGTAQADFAIEHFCYWAARHAGSMIAAMQGVDALVFTGGIGENSPEIRRRIVANLGWTGAGMDRAYNQSNALRLSPQTSRTPVWIVPAQEERKIAADALTLLAQGARF
ncbi:acetate/propionate family kinase [Shimia litoralis]|uniref:Acetate kinase n=1 Tax=Shimia litoralis TaxID=420403 RepID=A0A4U7N2L9_9RHOB|nr:acetate/propionate family kinase [Shimia litoralis]TKZ19426.1 acetate/propionate family kinase [Shimia litoralis]